MRCVLVHIANSSTQNSSLLGKKMQPTIMLVDTTPLAKSSLILCLIAFASWLISALAFRDFYSSTALVVALALASHLCLWNACLLTMAKSQSWNLPSTQPLRCLPPLWSHTTQSLPLTQPWSTPIVPSWLTTKPSMTSVAVTWTSSDLPTPT